MKYICSYCKTIVDPSEVNNIHNDCDHKWIVYYGIQDEPEELGGIIELEAEMVEEVKTEGVPSINNFDSADRKKLDDYTIDIRAPHTDKIYEKMYEDIKAKTGMDVSLPDFKEIAQALSSYDDETSDYIKLLTSKIIDKHTMTSVGKIAIGLETIMTNTMDNLIQRSKYLEEDEIGDNNLKLIQTAGKFLKDYTEMIQSIREMYVIPNVDRQLEEKKREIEFEKEQNDVVKLTSHEVKKLLDMASTSSSVSED